MEKELIKKLKIYLQSKDFLNFDKLINSLLINGNVKKSILYNFLGYKDLILNNLESAEHNFKSSIKENKSFDSLINLGATYLKMDRVEEAIDNFIQSIEIKKNNAESYIFLSKCYLYNKDYQKALDILGEGIKQVSPNDNILKHFAKVALDLKEYELAISLYAQILRKYPKDYIAFNNLGACYEALNQFSLAKKNYTKSINIFPKYEEALCNLGNLLRSEGLFDEAKKILLKALSISKSQCQIFRYLSVIHKFKTPNDIYLQKMLELEKKNLETDKSFLHELYFAIYKAYEDLNDFQLASKYLVKANQQKRSLLNYSNDHQKLHFEMMKDIFQENKAIFPDNLKEKPKSIFIVGMPRSGTTLVEQIISSHSNVVSGGELFYLQKYIKQFFPSSEPEQFKSSVYKNFKLYGPKIAQSYNLEINKISKDKIVTDKLPFNFLFIGFIKSIFKDVKIVHCKRSPMETCFSIYKNYFPFDELGFAYDQKELGEYYYLYDDIMSHWTKIYKDEIYEIEYDKLVENQNEETKKLINYCNLKWDDKCLNFYENKNIVKTLSTNQVRQPIYKTSLKSWKKYEKSLVDLSQALDKLSF